MVARQVQVTSSPTQISSFMVKGESAWFVNTDLANSVMVGEDKSSLPIPLQPLGSVELASNRDLWAATQSPNVSVLGLITSSQWNPSPAQVAIAAANLATNTTVQALGGSPGRSVAQDMLHNNNGVTTELAALLASGSPSGNAGGIPLLRYTNNLGSGNPVTLTSGLAVQLLNKVPITQPGYEALFALNLPAGSGTNPFASLILNWFDSVTGLNIKSVFYILTAGNGPSNSLNFYINGPCYGNQLSASITNLDSINNMSLSWAMNQTSHVFQTDKIVQPVYAQTAPITFTNPSGTPGLGLIAASQPTLAAASSTSRLLAVNSGRALLSVDNVGGANSMWARLQDPANLYSSLGAYGEPILVVGAGAAGQVEFGLPRGPMLLTIRNNGASGSITPGVSVTALDY